MKHSPHGAGPRRSRNAPTWGIWSGWRERSGLASTYGLDGEAGHYRRSLLLGTRAWMHDAVGETEAAVAELRRAWAQAGTNAPDFTRRVGVRLRRLLWVALELRAVDPDDVVRAHEEAWPGG